MKLSSTDIQGMMAGNWTPNTEKQVTATVRAVCLDGECWELRNEDEELLGTFNPTNALTSHELYQGIRKMAQNQSHSKDGQDYSSARSD